MVNAHKMAQARSENFIFGSAYGVTVDGDRHPDGKGEYIYMYIYVYTYI